MKLTPHEETTVTTYNKIAREWDAQNISREYHRDVFAKFKQLLPVGKILEIGVGGGRDARELISMGYEYVGVDISDGLLEIARENNPGVSFLHQSVYELSFEPKSFDGFWASAVLLHVPKDKIDKALQRIHDVVRDDGIGFISLHYGEGEGIKTSEKGDRYFAYYTYPEFIKVLRRNRFDVIESIQKDQESGKTWLYFIVRVLK